MFENRATNAVTYSLARWTMGGRFPCDADGRGHTTTPTAIATAAAGRTRRAQVVDLIDARA